MIYQDCNPTLYRLKWFLRDYFLRVSDVPTTKKCIFSLKGHCDSSPTWYNKLWFICMNFHLNIVHFIQTAAQKLLLGYDTHNNFYSYEDMDKKSLGKRNNKSSWYNTNKSIIIIACFYWALEFFIYVIPCLAIFNAK